MRRYNLDGRIIRVVGEFVETAGMEKKTVLLSLLSSYDIASRRFQNFAVSSVYRDRLAQVSGRTPREILDEVKVRAALLQALLDRNIMDMDEVSQFCCKYISDPQGVLKELKINRAALLKR